MGGVESDGKATLAPEMKRYFNFSRGQIAKLKYGQSLANLTQ